MEEQLLTLPPVPQHVLMPSVIELADANVPHVGTWSPRLCSNCRGERTFIGLIPGSMTETARFVCNCEEQLTLRRWFAVRGILKSYQDLRWVDMSGAHPEWVAAAASYAQSISDNLRFGRNMIFFGRSGSGKTGLAMLILKSVLYQRYTARALLLGATGSEESFLGWKDKERYNRWLSQMLGVDLLVLDDLGKEAEGSTKTIAKAIERMLTHRTDERRSTIITTNLSVDQLGTRYGDAMDVFQHEAMFQMSLPENWRYSGEQARNRFEEDVRIVRPAVWG